MFHREICDKKGVYGCCFLVSVKNQLPTISQVISDACNGKIQFENLNVAKTMY